ncbi:MAG: response regulator [Anaerolineae bacterium]
MKNNEETRQGAHVLVVDDNRPVVAVLHRALALRGYRVTDAYDGVAALECIRADRPDLVILDIDMPGIDGYEVCQQMSLDPDLASIGVLIVSGRGDLDLSECEGAVQRAISERLAGYAVGAMDFLSKPIRVSDVITRVQALLWVCGFPLESSQPQRAAVREAQP